MGRKTPPQFEVTIDRLVFGGEGMGYYDNRPVFVYGVLPGETVVVRPVKVNSRFVKAAVVEVVKPAPSRVPAQSSHYLTCSPWQVIPYDQQLAHKLTTTTSMWQKLGGELPTADVEIIPSPVQWQYRNKLEFSFMHNEMGELQLAFHQRYRYNKYLEASECLLGTKRLNECAQYVLSVLRERGVNIDQLKNVLVRYSYYTDSCIVGLYVTDLQFEVFNIAHEHIAGFHIIYSNPQSPAAVTTEVLSEQGDSFLQEQLLGTVLQFRFDSFFQVNPPAFESLMRYVKPYMLSTDTLLDLYAGVGTIGMLLADAARTVISVEFDAGASQSAEQNKELNSFNNVTVVNGAAEQYDLEFQLPKVSSVIVDPPRSGLHPAVAQAIAEYGPKHFIYISCNPATQARDYAILAKRYTAIAWQLVDLYPQTPHVESVVVMERKS